MEEATSNPLLTPRVKRSYENHDKKLLKNFRVDEGGLCPPESAREARNPLRVPDDH
jgi:hypothetical protein